MEITFSVPGKPRGGSRPRFDGRRHHAYMPKNDRDYRYEVALAARAANFASGPLPEGKAYSVRIVASFSPTRSWSARKRQDAIAQRFSPGKPDADNIAKIVLDGITAAGVWPDDRYVRELEVEKRWAEEDEVRVCITAE